MYTPRTKYKREEVEELILGILKKAEKKGLTSSSIARNSDPELFSKWNKNRMKIYHHLKKMVEQGKLKRIEKDKEILYKLS